MSTFFELPHVFVVFPPGAGGNFISGILTRVLNNNLHDLELSSTGNAHANSTTKLNFSDVLSCGLMYDIPKFNNANEKLQYYKSEIEKKHGNDTDIKVAWSHDFSNISLYKTIFPNCRILAVTQDSHKEKLAVLIQQELKNRLDPNGFVFLEEDIYLRSWKSSLERFLINILGLGKDITKEIVNNFMDIKYRSLVTYVSIRVMLRSHECLHLVNNKPEMINYLDNCYKPRIAENPEYVYREGDYACLIMGPSFKDCITDDCVVMPYEVIMNKDETEFLKAIVSVVGELNSEQVDFIRNNLYSYHKKQATGLMDDPKKYFYTVAKDASNQIEILKKIEMQMKPLEYYTQ